MKTDVYILILLLKIMIYIPNSAKLYFSRILVQKILIHHRFNLTTIRHFVTLNFIILDFETIII